MIEKISRLFKSENGKKIYDNILQTVSSDNMQEYIDGGVLLGLSGGADSVMLLCFFIEYKKSRSFSLACAHVNHSIRGEEAERDMKFSENLARMLDVEFISAKLDIPKISKERRLGIEEAARDERYRFFRNIISGRNDLSCVAVAHNSTDNLETVVFNMLRGSGLRGICGINPVRDNIIRPLIRVTKADIESVLRENDIPYCVDSTNFSTDYTRNYIRREILPTFKRLTDNPEFTVGRLCDNVRDSISFIDASADDFITINSFNDKISKTALLSLPRAVLSDVIIKIAQKYNISLEFTHITKIISLLSKDDFSYSLPGNLRFICEEGSCYIGTQIQEKTNGFNFKLNFGINEFSDFDAAIILSEEKIINSSLNVYKIAIQQKFDFDIIEGGVFVRSRLEGDSYVYGNMTHKLKKLFNDRKIPPSRRIFVPIVCDKDGILWPIGFSPRQNSQKNRNNKYFYIALAFKKSKTSDKSFYFKQNINNNEKGL